MVLDLTGVRALITGGTRGIGRAITDALASSGARVGVNFQKNATAADQFSQHLGERHFEHMMLKADVTQERVVRTMVKKIEESWGGLDVLVVNAGIWIRNPIGEMTAAEWRDMINVNLNGAFLTINESLRIMRSTDSQVKRIVIVSSAAGQRGEPFYSHYASAKGGLIALTKSLAVELAPTGITVNCVAPGWIATDMTQDVLADAHTRKEIIKTIPLGRVGIPEEVAAAVLFLASRQSSFITGEIINVNGGSVLCG